MLSPEFYVLQSKHTLTSVSIRSFVKKVPITSMVEKLSNIENTLVYLRDPTQYPKCTLDMTNYPVSHSREGCKDWMIYPTEICTGMIFCNCDRCRCSGWQKALALRKDCDIE
jgi:hypothetical protein